MPIRLTLVAAVILGLLAAQAAAPPQPPTLAAALARLQAQDPAGAARILEQVVAGDPANGRAWRNLGLAYQLLKDYDKAITAEKHALAVDPSMPTPLYALGEQYVLKKDNDQAYAWLKQAKDTHRIDMTQMTGDSDLDGLRDDPRYASLLPSPDDFAHPFVEPTTVIREWDGEAAGDQFGWIARGIGDVDGDGVPDIVTSAPTSNGGGKAAGRIYVYSTKSGALLWRADGHAGDQLGMGLEGAGDTNHDGIPDVIASAPGAGKAYVYSGRDGRVLLTLTAEHPDDNFGRHASGVGDVDGDGYDDVIVGAPLNDAGGKGGRTRLCLFRQRRPRTPDPDRRTSRGSIRCRCRGGDGQGPPLSDRRGPEGREPRNRPHVRVHLAGPETGVRHRVGRNRCRARGHVPGGGWGRRRRRHPGRLRLRLAERREGPFNRTRLRVFGEGRAPPADPDRRDGWGRVRDEPIGRGRCQSRRPRGSHRRGVAVCGRRAERRPRLSLLGEGRSVVADLHVPDSRRGVRVRRCFARRC